MTDDRTQAEASERAQRVSHAHGARRRSGARERVSGSPRGEAPRILKRAPRVIFFALLKRSAAQMRYAALGSLVLTFGLQLVLVGQAVSIQDSQSFAGVAGLIPSFIGRGLGSNTLLLASFKGTVMLGYFHPLLCVLIPSIAMYAATEPAHEVEAGFVDLVLARSMPRALLLTRSLTLALLYAAAAVSVMALGTYAGVLLFHAARYDLPSADLIARLLLHVFAVSACFAGYGLFAGVTSKRWSTAFTTAVLTAVLAYLVDFLALGWPVLRWPAYLSPYRYYHALAIASGTAWEVRDYLVLLGTGAAFTLAAYWRFQRRDL
jgi:ABC-2 type transport system permease protein